jgi:hypothetical protein
MRNRIIALTLLLPLFLPASALAGRIFGDITLDGKPLPAGVPVKIARVPGSGDKPTATPPADSTTTDKFGSYKLMMKEPGKCTLTIRYEKLIASLEVFSYKEATRYDLVLEKKDGALSLRRK